MALNSLLTGPRDRAVPIALLCIAAFLPGGARAEGDVFDSFFRYTEREHKAFTQELPGETVEPFTGTLRIVQVDLTLPGKANRDLQIMRTYNSRIWGRTDLLTTEPLLAEKEHSVLGYGWTFHMGRIRNPNASLTAVGTPGCQVLDVPIYEAPDGTARVFYPITAGSTVLKSRDFWRMEKNCSALGGQGTCIWSDKGVRYDFPNAGASTFFEGTTLFWAVTQITDPFNNTITIAYSGTGDKPSLITDTYQRQIAFAYQAAEDGSRLSSMTENGHTYSYIYTFVPTGSTGGAGSLALPGTGRLFLTEFRPPAGTSPSYFYQYGTTATVAQNQYALTQVTYPYGATMSYAYSSFGFFTGSESVPMAGVSQRTSGGAAMAPGTWSYNYSSPSAGMQTANITRPDGRQDSYSMYGFGAVASGSAWRVGLTQTMTIGSTQTSTFTWDNRSAAPVTTAMPYPAPNYSPSSTASCTAPFDNAVYAPSMSQRVVSQDGSSYTTTYSSFDQFGQPQSALESGQQSRTTTRTYFSAATTGTTALTMVRGFPLSQHVCVGGTTDCYDNNWTYNGGSGHAPDSKTLAGTATTFGYDGSGNLTTVKNALNQTLTLGSYTNGVPTTFNFNGAFTTSQTPNFEGWITSETNGRSATTGHGYDAIGRPISETPPLVAPASSYSYLTGGSCLLSGVVVPSAPAACVKLTRGSYTQTSFFDGLGRVIAISDSTGVITSTKYDALGRVTFKSYPFDSTVAEVGDSITVDGLGRPTTIKKGFRPTSTGGSCDDANSCTTTISYSSNCATTAIQRAAGDATTTNRCSASFGDPTEQRLISVTDANAKLWQYAYSAHGDLTTVTAPDAKGNETYTYSSTNQFLLTEKSSESSVGAQPSLTYTRNAAGQPDTRSDARGIVTTYTYEPQLNRLKSMTFSSSSTSFPNATRGALTNTFDDVNRATQTKWVVNGLTFTTTPHYDSNGCMDSLTYPTGTAVTQGCDTANRVTSISIGTGSIVSSVQYHPSGQPKSMVYGNGSSTTSTFDDRARAKTITAASVIDLRYNSYDGANNVKSFDNLAVAGASRTMTYDALDRLVTATAPSMWGTGTYDYDVLGNRTFNSDNLVTVTYTYDANNRLSAAATGVRPRPMQFTWDGANHLASSSDGATYFYDGLGRRVQKTDSSGTVLYHYDPTGKLISESDGAGVKLRDYIYLAGKLIAVDGCINTNTPPCSERQWFHTDIKGSVVARSDTAGVVVARLDYKPWGEQWQPPAAQGDRQLDGRVRDPGTGFSDFGARYYWPEIGRFVSADPHPYGSQQNIGFNRYAFGFDNPYKYTDPNGHMPFLAVTGLIGAVGGGIYGAISSANSQEGFSWGAVGKWAAVGGVAGLTLGAGTGLALGVGATASVAEVGGAAAATLSFIGGLTAARFDWQRAGHIFRNAAGHVNPSTVASQARYADLFQKVASNPENLRQDAVEARIITQEAADAGVRAFTWMARNGEQVWATVLDGTILNAGVNAAQAVR